MCKTKFNVGDRVVDKLHNAYEVVEVSSSGITLDVTSIAPLPIDPLSSKKRLSEEDFPRFIPYSSKKYPLEVLAFSNLRRIHKADEVPSFFQPTLNTLKMGTIIVQRQPESKRISFTFMKDFVWETTTEGKDSSILTDQIAFLEGGFKGGEETSFMETMSYIIDDVKDRKVTRRKNEDGLEEVIDFIKQYAIVDVFDEGDGMREITAESINKIAELLPAGGDFHSESVCSFEVEREMLNFTADNQAVTLGAKDSAVSLQGRNSGIDLCSSENTIVVLSGTG